MRKVSSSKRDFKVMFSWSFFPLECGFIFVLSPRGHEALGSGQKGKKKKSLKENIGKNTGFARKKEIEMKVLKTVCFFSGI